MYVCMYVCMYVYVHILRHQINWFNIARDIMRIVVMITNNDKDGSHKDEYKNLTTPVTHIRHKIIKLFQSHSAIWLFKIPPML